jgi:hypothetical protein
MLHKFAGLAILLGLATFIWFAFRQGLGVKPDRNNRDNWRERGGGYGADGGHGSDDGHGGGAF